MIQASHQLLSLSASCVVLSDFCENAAVIFNRLNKYYVDFLNFYAFAHMLVPNIYVIGMIYDSEITCHKNAIYKKS